MGHGTKMFENHWFNQGCGAGIKKIFDGGAGAGTMEAEIWVPFPQTYFVG